MIKKEILFSTILVILLFLVSCAPRPSEPAPTAPEETPATTVPPSTVTPAEEVPTTGEAPIDSVGNDISDAGTTDDELDTSDLNDVDSILSDIENI